MALTTNVQLSPPSWPWSWRELTLVVFGFAALTVFLTWPLAAHLETLGRADNGDGRISIWNVAWVARALVIDPRHVFDANIFYPHTGTLVYSESNLGAGALAIPVYWTTGSPYAAHNFVFLLSFVLSATGMYYLVRYLARDRRAAAVAATCFAFCPYVFAHTPHIQLLMTAGLPFSMLAFHRLADQPTWRRGVVLGLTMAGQALFCGYYAVFVMLMVGFAVLVVAVGDRWTDVRFWAAVLVAAVVAIVVVWPLFVPYSRLQHATGFHRALEDARQWSANWRMYFVSSSAAHLRLLRLSGPANEVVFPGVVALGFGGAGLAVGWAARGRWREVSVLYGALAVLACWASFGPDGGLYGVLYAAVPVFSLLHAPSRFGLVVTFALSVLAGVSISALLRRRVAPRLTTVVLLAAAIAELRVTLTFSPIPPVDTAYRVLAGLPRGAVIEMPVYSRRVAFARTQYMLSSTAHWMPLVDAYSDYIPEDFSNNAAALGGFPSRDSFAILNRDHVRYAVFHLDLFDPAARLDVLARLREFDRYLMRRYGDDKTQLYEIVGSPP